MAYVYAIFLFPWVLLASQAPVYLGILEATGSVRVAFRFQDGQWSAMPQDAPDFEALSSIAKQYPDHLAWTIALDGKKLGTVNSVRPPVYSRYADIGLQELTPDSNPPRIRQGAAAFATWMGAQPVRPLAAISQPNSSDPDRWKPFVPPAPEQASKAYCSATGDVLLAFRAHPSVWFLVRKGVNTRIGGDLTLLDTGDYDGDGASEVIFQSSGYNRDGYILFHPRDGSKQEFHWSYH